MDSLALLVRLLLALWAQKHLIHHHGILHNIAFNQGIHFSAKEVWPWAQAYGISLIISLVTQNNWPERMVG